MSDFFCGWRRKTGCVLLVMAAMLTVFWVRSYSRPGLMQIGNGRWHVLHSTGGTIHWMSWIQPRGEPQIALYFMSSVPAEDLAKLYELSRADLLKDNIAFRESAIPYWPITLPVTLLSAYLILWPGKRAKSPQVHKSTGAST